MGLSNILCPHMESPFWLSSSQSGDASCSCNSKMGPASICSWRFLWAAFVLNPTPHLGSWWSGSYEAVAFYSNAAFFVKMLYSVICLDVMIVQELRCIPYGHKWGLRLSKYSAHCGSAPHYEGCLIKWALYEVWFLPGIRYGGEGSRAMVSIKNTWNYNHWQIASLFYVNCGVLRYIK